MNNYNPVSERNDSKAYTPSCLGLISASRSYRYNYDEINDILYCASITTLHII